MNPHRLGSPHPRLTSYRGLAVVLVYLALAAGALYPIFSVSVPPLIDYPNHLARMHILAEIAEDPALQANYTVDWRIVPNLAMDILLLPVTRVLSAVEASRLFVAMTLMLMVGGTLALHRVVHGRIGLWPAAVFLFLYNYNLEWGFLNYQFSVGLYLILFAGWIATGRWRGWIRLVLFSSAALALFFAHFFAFCIYGLSVASYELWRGFGFGERTLRRIVLQWAIALGQFAIPCVLWLTFAPLLESTVTRYGTIGHKIVAALSPTLFQLEPIDLVTLVFVCIVLAGGLLSRTIRLAPELRFPLIFLGLAAVLMPNILLNVWAVDFRLPPVLACLVVAGTQIAPWDRKTAMIVATTALILFGAKVWSLGQSWQSLDQDFAELRSASQVIEPGARLLPVLNLPAFVDAPDQRSSDQIYGLLALTGSPAVRTSDGRSVPSLLYWHVPALTVVERSVYLPTLFTGPQQPLRAAPANERIDTPAGRAVTLPQLMEGADPIRSRKLVNMVDRLGNKAYWAFWPENFDYLLLLDFGEPRNPFPGLLEPLHKGTYFTIYAVKGAPKQDQVIE
jgi:hypothetical protein